MNHADRAIPFRHRLRWANGVGFALTFFFAMWLLVFVLALAKERFSGVELPMPTAFWIVGLLSLTAAIVLLAIVLFRFAWQGADLNDWEPRMYLFAWTCAGGLFFLSQTIALFRSDTGIFPHVPGWLSEVYWYFVVVGAATFVLLLWVNAEGHAPHGTYDEEYEYDGDDAYDEGD